MSDLDDKFLLTTSLPADLPKPEEVQEAPPEGVSIPDYHLVRYDDPVLRQVAEEFDFDNPQVPVAEITYGLAVAMQKNNGYGLSAPQVGLSYRVCVIRSHPQITVMFNPKIVDTSMKRVDIDEACLSVPGISHPVKRPEHIRVRFRSPAGEYFTQKFTGMTARVIQHELDHLDGILFTDYMEKAELKRAINVVSKFGLFYHYGKLAKSDV